MKELPPILLVGHNKQNLTLLGQLLGKEGFPTTSASSLEELDRVLDEEKAISLVLLDLGGFDRGIWERCARLQDRLIPFIAIYPKESDRIQLESITHGAHSVLVKPLSAKHILGIVKAMLESEP
ncbi:MAG TPA: response regulator [Cyanobacteria bacterium UBA8530]|nr:response regulator [Cyanobacteria bacterium UBA8530]